MPVPANSVLLIENLLDTQHRRGVGQSGTLSFDGGGGSNAEAFTVAAG